MLRNPGALSSGWIPNKIIPSHTENPLNSIFPGRSDKKKPDDFPVGPGSPVAPSPPDGPNRTPPRRMVQKSTFQSPPKNEDKPRRRSVPSVANDFNMDPAGPWPSARPIDRVAPFSRVSCRRTGWGIPNLRASVSPNPCWKTPVPTEADSTT